MRAVSDFRNYRAGPLSITGKAIEFERQVRHVDRYTKDSTCTCAFWDQGCFVDETG